MSCNRKILALLPYQNTKITRLEPKSVFFAKICSFLPEFFFYFIGIGLPLQYLPLCNTPLINGLSQN